MCNAHGRPNRPLWPQSANGFERLASSALDYLRSRSSDHWLMFVVGVAIGLFLG